MPTSNRILTREILAPEVYRYEIEAAEISKKAKPGQFVILRLSETGERFPLTIAEADPGEGRITLIFRKLGKSTSDLASLRKGDCILDLVGPLGKPSRIERYGRVVCIGGGVGMAPLLPIARALRNAENRITTILGARTREEIFLEKEFEAMSDQIFFSTDDGSYGRHGFVTDCLRDLLDGGAQIDAVFAVGPAVMMKAVADLTRPRKIRTIVSLNPIMIDGTGMCGGCRVTVGGKTRLTCVDGPEFDAHQVDFDELMKRQRFYEKEEALSAERATRGKGCCGRGGR